MTNILVAKHTKQGLDKVKFILRPAIMFTLR